MSVFDMEFVHHCAYDPTHDFGQVEITPDFLDPVDDIINTEDVLQYPEPVIDKLRRVCFITTSRMHLNMVLDDPNMGYTVAAILAANEEHLAELVREIFELLTAPDEFERAFDGMDLDA
jgi:hypothetical protein